MDQAHGAVVSGSATGATAGSVAPAVPNNDTRTAAPAAVSVRLDRQILIWVFLAAGLAVCLYLFSGVMMPFVAGIALGYLLDPLADRLEKIGVNRLGAALIILAGFVLVLVVLLLIFVPVLGKQLSAFISALPALGAKLQSLASSGGERLTDSWIGSILTKLGVAPGSGSNDLQSVLQDSLGQAASWAIAFSKSLLLGGAALISLFSLLVVTPVVAFYILVDWKRMIATLDGLVPLRHREEVRFLARDIDRALAGFLRGQSLVCMFLGAWYAIGLSLIGLNFGFLIGITAGILSFIPYVGSLTALVLSAGVALVQGWPDWKLSVLSLAVVVSGQFLEGNILSPKLVGASVGLHPVWLMFALLAFGSLFGFTGLIMAVPVAAAIGVLLRFAVRRYRASPLYLGQDLGGPVIESSTVRLDRAPAP